MNLYTPSCFSSILNCIFLIKNIKPPLVNLSFYKLKLINQEVKVYKRVDSYDYSVIL